MIPFNYRPNRGPGSAKREALITKLAEELSDEEINELENILENVKSSPKRVAKHKGPPKLDPAKRQLALANKAVEAYTFDEPRKLTDGKSRSVPAISLRAKGKKPDVVIETTIAKPVKATLVITPKKPTGMPQRMPGHIIVDAVAGSGKTTILEEGVRRILGKPPKFKGSEQQQDIWQELCRGPAPKSIVVVSCMNSIVDELNNRLLAPAYATTCHKFGRNIIYKNIGTKKPEVEEDKVRFLLQDYMGITLHTIYRRMPQFVQAVCKLVKFCKICLVDLDLMEDENDIYDAVQRLIGTYDIEVRDEYMEPLLKVAPAMMRMSFENLDTMDYDDMLWLPHRLNVRSRPHDLVMVDERQDLNHAQQELIFKNAKRIMVVGDTNQAVMGFAGGDFEACEHMNERLMSSHIKAKIFPLTYTRRCSKAVVALAQTLVPEIQALPEAPDGTIEEISEELFAKNILGLEDGDMIISRTNAPLVQYAMQLLRNHRRVRIQGRNFGEEMCNLVREFGAKNLPELVTMVDNWYYAQKAKLESQKYVSDSKLIALFDQYTSLVSFIRESKTINDVIEMIRSLFTDREDNGVLFSSIHRAKGLEPPAGRTVYFLRYNQMPHPMAQTTKAIKQEYNLQYVGITRAKEKLVLVMGDSKTTNKGKLNASSKSY